MPTLEYFNVLVFFKLFTISEVLVRLSSWVEACVHTEIPVRVHKSAV